MSYGFSSLEATMSKNMGSAPFFGMEYFWADVGLGRWVPRGGCTRDTHALR